MSGLINDLLESHYGQEISQDIMKEQIESPRLPDNDGMLKIAKEVKARRNPNVAAKVCKICGSPIFGERCLQKHV